MGKILCAEFLGCISRETVFPSISSRLSERERERERKKIEERKEKNCPNSPHPHLLQEQKALVPTIIQISRTPRH